MKFAVKCLTCVTVILCISFSGNSQVFKNITDRVKQKVNQRINQKTDQAIDKGLDKAEKKGKGADKKKDGTTANPADNTIADNKETASGKRTAAPAEPSLEVYSKFDFVPGDKVIAYDDFSNDAIGDFPVTWNTNSSGEVVNASTHGGKWLMVRKAGKFIPEYIKNIPDNFTFEYDVVCNDQYNFHSPVLSIYFLSGLNGKGVFDQSFIILEKRSGVKIGIFPTNASSNGGIAYFENYEDGATVIRNETNTSQFNSLTGKTKLHVSIWRQKQRVRVYLNEEKVYDLPRAFLAGKSYNTVLFEIFGEIKNEDRYLISNIKLSAGAPDTRNKLVTEGRFVTRGILFDVKSDKIKPESAGVLKEIAAVLTENASMKVKVIGHTDSDGSDADNLTLSKQRAESVKNSLVSDFGVDASRLDTDGKGESQPADKNTTPEAKANNRRVEFIKL